MSKGKKYMLENRVIFTVISLILFSLISINLIINYNLSNEVSKLQQGQLIISNQINKESRLYDQ